MTFYCVLLLLDLLNVKPIKKLGKDKSNLAIEQLILNPFIRIILKHKAN